jgi:NADH-quinone oxidoreductase subunit N
MLCVGADDLVWLFLALELTSLPTYVMVSISRERIVAPEAGVKYFFLGAFAAAIFLYGFTLLYGATGTTYFMPLGDTSGSLAGLNAVFAEQSINAMAVIGLLLAITGIAFKIAAVPMHFYAADVYQGAATPVTAFLAFVPKTAGFIALIALLSTIGWPLEAAGRYGEAIVALLWIMAVLTMFLGNTLALRQQNVKRVLAYSSIAHSGYMLVGLVAGPGLAGEDSTLFVRNGIAAVLFYLVAYGLMNLGAFAVLGILHHRGEEAETYEDLHGLAQRHPWLATIMAVCVFSLTGLPPILGFWGKIYLVGAAVSAGYIVLVVLTVIASAIAAVYYLRIIAACFLPEPNVETVRQDRPWRLVAAGASALAVVVLSFFAGWLLEASGNAADFATRPAAPANVAATETLDAVETLDTVR